ncbi:Coenzyme Q-binding protein COQ10 START domain [Arabidopsis suecica]|uniref:Polyketide cyclase / dehydrase and lipid transport protein n=2 Tax=Arabidopsis TaxID=3701 RepID=A0A1P8B516_ARATH|nr:Polyketide cyclase / dehydrase and lipid transport protein [Arabidopsis thaliana]ANM66681.1 Polyketide cyclase / dehydrase and lipid transport protein [Arabidopsis thaliana]KAG7619306.1 Coenzyme Q-binding protein COQ10 START domain [Arabidopsis suecica]|eukprot:NP_001328563.1 Polyketide cyclase / dehydrase and lipid transport protein [Arabidopsis thaliana]
MSATAILSVNNPKDLVTGFGNRTFHSRSNFAKPSSRLFPSSSSPMKPLTLASRFSPLISTNRSFKSSVFRRFDTLMEWQECKVKMKVEVPVSVAYGLYSERESIPKWMTFISSVKVLKDKPDLSRWTLKYKAFGQNLEYAWLAKNLQPLPNQKIHWISLEGLPNKGTVRFFPLGPSSCDVEVSFHCSYHRFSTFQ